MYLTILVKISFLLIPRHDEVSISIILTVSLSIYLFNFIEHNCKCTKLQLSIFNNMIKNNLMINSKNNTSITVGWKFIHFKTQISYIITYEISCKGFGHCPISIFSFMSVLWYTVSDSIYFCPVTTMILAELNMYLVRIVAPFTLNEWLV